MLWTVDQGGKSNWGKYEIPTTGSFAPQNAFIQAIDSFLFSWKFFDIHDRWNWTLKKWIKNVDEKIDV